MTPRAILAILIGLGLVMTMALLAARGPDFLSPQAMTLIGVGCVLVVARPAWGIAGRVVSPKE